MKKTDEEIRKEIQHIVFSWLNKAREQGRKQAKEEVLKKVTELINQRIDYHKEEMIIEPINSKVEIEFLKRVLKQLKKEKGG